MFITKDIYFMIFSMLWVLRRVLLFWEKILFWKWNDLEICSVKWNSGKFPDEMETTIFLVTFLRNPEFYPVYGMKTRNLRNHVLECSAKIQVCILWTGKISGFHPIYWKNSNFNSVNPKDFWVPWRKLENVQVLNRKPEKIPGLHSGSQYGNLNLWSKLKISCFP